MRKTEFLQELREALDGEVSASVIQISISARRRRKGAGRKK